tara:strand:- start:155 stop:748 length:594 start_codon:yes stop_codon:yes gene_type:complete
MTVYDHQKPVTGPLSFRHFYVVEYRPGEDELTNYRAKKRRNGAMYEEVNKDNFKPHMMYDPKTGKGYMAKKYEDHVRMNKMGYTHDKPEVDEALTLQQRQKRSRIMKRLKSRIKIGRERQKRKMADKGRLQKRAIKQARNKLVKKITKGKSKKDLSFARRQEIEKRLEKPAMKKRIERLAKRMFPQIRRAEVQRKKG